MHSVDSPSCKAPWIRGRKVSVINAIAIIAGKAGGVDGDHAERGGRGGKEPKEGPLYYIRMSSYSLEPSPMSSP